MSIYILVLLCLGIITPLINFLVGVWAGDKSEPGILALAGFIISFVSFICCIIGVIFQACILAGI